MIAKAPQWPADKVERRAVSSLKPYAKNSRTHSEAQIEQIARSITEFGFTVPVLIDPKGEIIAGHGRVLAAASLGLADVPVMVAKGWTAAQKRAYVIADNKLALNAGWDEDILSEELKALGADGFDLSLTGFDNVELVSFLSDGDKESAPDELPPAPAAITTQPGDVWICGDHRVMCGDCTSDADVAALMDGESAALCLTDPPYGLGAGKESGKNAYDIYDDTPANLVDLASKWLPIARSVAKVVVFSPGVTNQWIYPKPDWVMCWFYGGGQLRSSWGFNCWQPFLCYGKEPGLAAGKGARPDAVDMNTPANAGDIDHPCPKPVKLWEWLIDRLVFKKGAIIFEPFCGSGTALVAAEAKGAIVRAMELSPKYVDIAVLRWEAFTGRKAVLMGDGSTFADLAAQRAKVAA